MTLTKIAQAAIPGSTCELLGVPGEFRTEPWEQRAVALFEQRMLDTSAPFPCVFGVDAVRRRTLRYCFIPAGSTRLELLCSALREFAGQCRELGRRTSLVAFFEPDGSVQSMDWYRDEFWRLLSAVSATDDQAWPAEIDIDTESPTWEFSSFGVPFFVVANTPSHRIRASRYFEYFTITFQPRFVFEDLGAESTTGRNARKVIRERLRNYDSVAPHPQLGSFGESTNREWVQYFLADDNFPVPSAEKCPFVHVNNRGDITMFELEFVQALPRQIPPDLLELVPEQGSIELQHDQPGKIFGWHQHDLDEELYVLSGDLMLFWIDAAGGYQERHCEPGACIKLPAGTVHGSTAGRGGVHYVIRPEGGGTAVTTFLPKEQWPYPAVRPDRVG